MTILENRCVSREVSTSFFLPCTMHFVNIKLHSTKKNALILKLIWMFILFTPLRKQRKRVAVNEEVFLPECDSFARCISQIWVRRQEKLKLHVKHHTSLYLNKIRVETKGISEKCTWHSKRGLSRKGTKWDKVNEQKWAAIDDWPLSMSYSISGFWCQQTKYNDSDLVCYDHE